MPEVDDVKRTAALSVLGLPVGASWPQIAQRYHRLLFQVHPDRHAAEPVGEETAGQMMRITAAYRILRQDHQREEGGRQEHQYQDRQIHDSSRNDGTIWRPRRISADRSTMSRVGPSIVAGPVSIIAPDSEPRRQR